MGDGSKIEWTDATWNPVTGCTKVSPGCDNCYAETFAERWRGIPGHHFEAGFDLTLRPERLDQPLRWSRPRRVFVNSMSDLFHDDVPDEYIARIFAAMGLARRHTFQVLTKRHGRMRSLLTRHDFREAVAEHGSDLIGSQPWRRGQIEVTDWTGTPTGTGDTLWSPPWPLPNVWLGVSVEDQKRAELRIPALIDTPAMVRFLSCEPLLGPIDLARTDKDALVDGGIGWVIVGGESGTQARPMHPDWARALRDQTTEAGVPFFFKQWGTWAPGDVHRWYSRTTWVEDPDGRRSALMYAAKSKALRELDGRTWDEYPEADHAS